MILTREVPDNIYSNITLMKPRYNIKEHDTADINHTSNKKTPFLKQRHCWAPGL